MRRITRLALVVLAILAVGGCDWPTFRFTPAHTGYNPNESTIGTANVALIRPTWNASFGEGPLAQTGTAAVVGGRAYVGAGDGNLYVFSATTGALQWQGTGILAAGLSSPTVADGIVYAGTAGENTELWAWDATGQTNCGGIPKTCTPLWSFSADGNLSAPVVVNGVVYIDEAQGGYLYAIDAHTGNELWRALVGDHSHASPSVASGIVYVAAGANGLFAFDAAGQQGCGGVPKSCQPLWSATAGGSLFTTPAIANGVAYVTASDGWLYAFSAAGTTACSGSPKTCAPLWKALVWTEPSSPAVANGVVYASSRGSGMLWAFDAAGTTGCSGSPKKCTPLWTTRTPFAGSSPTVANGVVYIASDWLYAYDAAGSLNCSGTPKVCEPLAVKNLGGAESANEPVVVNGWVYATTNAALHAFTLPPAP